jgi:hypothetical protein
VGLERAQVVVDLLPRQPDPLGQDRRGRGLGQLGQEPRSDRIERDGRGGGVLDDVDVERDGLRAAAGARFAR